MVAARLACSRSAFSRLRRLGDCLLAVLSLLLHIAKSKKPNEV
jgi:hypothetical protein